MSRIVDIRRPRDHRFARQSHRRSRRGARLRAPWAAPRCLPAPPPAHAKPWNCATATSSATWARACARPWRTSTAALRTALLGLDASDQEGLDRKMIELDGTDNKGAPRRQRAAGRLAGHRARRGARCEAAAVPATSRRAAQPHAGADDEHHQRRRACRQQSRHPGVHDPAGRRAELSRGAALRRGDLPHAQEDPARSGLATSVGDEGGFAPNLRSNEEALDDHPRGRSTRPATRPARTSTSASTSRSSEFFKDGRYDLEGRGAAASPPPSSPTTWPDLVAQLSDHHHRGWHGAKATGPAGSCSPTSSARRCSWSATTCSSPTPRSCRKASTRSIANAILIKVNQIGTLTETLEAIDMADAGGYASVVSHRSGETEDSTIADIAVATAATQIKTGSHVALGPHREVQPAAAHRRASWARRALCGRDAFPGSALWRASRCSAPMKWLAAALLVAVVLLAVPAVDLRRRRSRAVRGSRRPSTRSASRTSASPSATSSSPPKCAISSRASTALEERARSELGMIARNETFYQVVPPRSRAGRRRSDAHGRALARSPMRYWLVMPAAGSRPPVRRRSPKQYATLHGRTRHRVGAAPRSLADPRCAGIAVAIADRTTRAGRGSRERLPNVTVTPGGAERARLGAQRTRHARPPRVDRRTGCWSTTPRGPASRRQICDRLLAQLGTHAVGGLLAVPLTDTLKRDRRQSVPSRRRSIARGLWRAQTPQMFRYALLLEALGRAARGAPLPDRRGAGDRMARRRSRGWSRVRRRQHQDHDAGTIWSLAEAILQARRSTGLKHRPGFRRPCLRRPAIT